MAIELELGSFDAILFDCDGTLVDTYALHLKSLQTALAPYGLTMRRDWYMARTGLAPGQLLDEYAALVAPLPMTQAALIERVTAAFQANMHTLREVSLVADLARAWHGKVPMAVGSNGTLVNVRGSLEAAGLLAYFDAIVAIDDVEFGKPAPDVYLEAARRVGVVAKRCVVLEDSDEGMMSAAAAGMKAIDVRAVDWAVSQKLGAIEAPRVKRFIRLNQGHECPCSLRRIAAREPVVAHPHVWVASTPVGISRSQVPEAGPGAPIVVIRMAFAAAD